MQIKIKLSGQARTLLARDSELLECAPPITAAGALQALAAGNPGDFSRLLLTESGALHPSILLFINDVQIGVNDQRQLVDGDTVLIMSPIAGG